MSIEHFEGFLERVPVTTIGSKEAGIRDQSAPFREGLNDEKLSTRCGETSLSHKRNIKSIAKTGKKEGCKFDKAILGAALDEMNDTDGLFAMDLNYLTLACQMGMGVVIGQAGGGSE